MSFVYQDGPVLFRVSSLAWPMEYEVHVLVSNMHYTDVTHTERSLMAKCVVLTKPFLLNVHLERPCAQELKGRYLYVVMIFLNEGTSTMGIKDLKVYSSTYWKSVIDIRIVVQ